MRPLALILALACPAAALDHDSARAWFASLGASPSQALKGSWRRLAEVPEPPASPTVSDADGAGWLLGIAAAPDGRLAAARSFGLPPARAEGPGAAAVADGSFTFAESSTRLRHRPGPHGVEVETFTFRTEEAYECRAHRPEFLLCRVERVRTIVPGWDDAVDETRETRFELYKKTPWRSAR